VKTIAVVFYETPWFKAALYVVIAVVAARVVDALLARRDRAMSRLLGKQPDRADRTRFVMIRRLVQIGILFFGVALALTQFEVVGALARALLASAAILAGIVGIAARTPIANLVSGVMIAFSQPVRLGDYISVDGEYGTVEEIRLTYTYIRTFDNRRVVIPNETFASTVVHNYSMGSPGSMVAVTFAVPAKVDVEMVRAAALEIADELAPAPENKTNTVEVDDIRGKEIVLRVHAWAQDPIGRRDLASTLRVALLRRLYADGVLDPVRKDHDAG
jgi:small-conductance mechanosensitive channel